MPDTLPDSDTPGSSTHTGNPAAAWALIGIAAVLVGIASWIHYRFGEVTFEQIVANLPLTTPGKGVGNSGLVGEAAFYAIGLPIAIVGVLVFVARLMPQPLFTGRRTRLIPLVAVVTALGTLLSIAGVPQYAVAQLSPESIAPYYRVPTVVSAPAKPKNLITIYLESTENTFGDASVVGQNLLVNLDTATTDAGWHTYDGLEQYHGGGWTMAGLVSTQCGIALKSQLSLQGMDPNLMGQQVEHYLPGATCLGDVLADQGYVSAFVGGADDDFAGKKTFLTDHGYQTVLGLPDWKAAGEDEKYISQAWGLADARTFVHAESQLRRLQRGNKPFNLTVLTLDTHEPAGVFPGCSTDDEVTFDTAIKCSQKAVARFLQRAEKAGLLDNTVVVIMGDHLKGTGPNDAHHEQLAAVADRTIVFRVRSPQPVTFARARADQLSVLPTTLELLGFGLDGGRGGLGVSFVADHDLSQTVLSLPPERYRTVLDAASAASYQGFWAAR